MFFRLSIIGLFSHLVRTILRTGRALANLVFDLLYVAWDLIFIVLTLAWIIVQVIILPFTFFRKKKSVVS